MTATIERTEFVIDGIHTYRYAVENPDYAILICHGAGGWGGMYDAFCLPLAQQHRVDIWALDLPGFGLTGTRGTFTATEQHAAVARIAREVKAHSPGLLVCLGSSMGGLYASAASYLDEVDAVVVSATHLICGGPVYEGSGRLFNAPDVQALLNSPMGKSLLLDLDRLIDWERNYGDPDYAAKIVKNPMHTGQIDLISYATMFNWQPPRPLSDNTKPWLYMIAERDPLAPLEIVKKVYAAVGGPTTLKVFPSDHHQIMLFETEQYIDTLDTWCREQKSAQLSHHAPPGDQ